MEVEKFIDHCGPDWYGWCVLRSQKTAHTAALVSHPRDHLAQSQVVAAFEKCNWTNYAWLILPDRCFGKHWPVSSKLSRRKSFQDHEGPDSFAHWLKERSIGMYVETCEIMCLLHKVKRRIEQNTAFIQVFMSPGTVLGIIIN